MNQTTGEMEVESVHIPDINFAAYNPRSISQLELQKLARSIEEFGFVEPVIVNQRSEAKGWSSADQHPTIVGGHQRVRAALMLGWTHVPCVNVDLAEAQEKVLNLALNKISGDWDGALLADLLEEIKELPIDIALTGFDNSEIDRLIAAANIEPPDDFGTVAVSPGDVETKHKCPSCGYEF